MRLLASIFLFYFSSLTVQPMITMIGNGLANEKEVCTMGCCQHHKPENKQTKKLPFGCCNNDMSNPFAQCCCCTGFIAEKQNTSISVSPNYFKQSFSNTGVLVPNYYSNCWHPPEMTV